MKNNKKVHIKNKNNYYKLSKILNYLKLKNNLELL